MALSIRNPNSRGSVGLDLDSAYLAAVQLSGGRISRRASVGLDRGAIEDGEVADAEALAGALKDFFKRESLPRDVRLGVANQQIVLRHLELPPIEDEQELAAAVRYQAAEAIPMPLDEVVLDHQVVGERTDAEGNRRMQLVVVAARRAMVGAFADCVRAAGLRPVGVDLDAFAIVRALAAPTVSDEGARLYCHIAGVTTLAIAVGSSCLFTRVLSAGGDASVEKLAEDVRLSIDTYTGLPGAAPVAEVVLAGPLARADGLEAKLHGLLELPVSIAAPLGRLADGQTPAGEDAERETVAAGLALGASA